MAIDNLHVSEVRLSVIDTSLVADEDEAAAYLLGLSDDPDGLAAWYTAAAAGDPGTFERDLISMVDAAGDEGAPRLVSSLGAAFKSQPPSGQDALLNLAMKPGTVRDLVGELFESFSASEIAGSILSGAFGKNMMALSNALSSLPLESIAAEVRAELEEMLPRAGHTPEEAGFLDHMLEVRARRELEQPLVVTDSTYNAVLTASTLSDEDVARACAAVGASRRDMNAAGVRAMLTLMDEQTDFERYCRSAENLAGIVPHLIEQGDLALAAQVLNELSLRQSKNTGPWPELSARLEAAIAVASGPRSMNALVKAVVAEPPLVTEACEIVHYAGDAGGPPLVAEAIALKDEGIAVAEQLLGRRVVDLLNAAAPETPWHLLGPVVRRLADEDDPHSIATIEALMQRPDEQSRREVVNALACVSSPNANRLLASALRDPRPETVTVAARAIARSGVPGSADLLSARLFELDMDHSEFAAAKELIGALARTPEPAADEALAKLGSRRAFIKRGHFSDIQSLVAEARRARKGGIAR